MTDETPLTDDPAAEATAPETPRAAGAGAQPHETFGERAGRLERLDALLAERGGLFFRTGEAEWRGAFPLCGLNYVTIRVRADGGTVHFRLDHGIRVPADRAREANKYIMLKNIELRLKGLDPLPREGGAVTFSFQLDAERLGLDAEEDEWELLRDNDDDGNGDGSPERGEKLLETAMRLSRGTVRACIIDFNDIVYGRMGALEVYAR